MMDGERLWEVRFASSEGSIAEERGKASMDYDPLAIVFTETNPLPPG